MFAAIVSLMALLQPPAMLRSSPARALPRQVAAKMASEADAAAAQAAVMAAAASAASLNATYFATMLEATFVPAVLSLSSGDVTELKLFIASAQGAHAKSLSLDEVSAELDACPAQSAGRPLADEEAELRRLWIALVYLALDVESPLVPEPLRAEHAQLVSGISQARREQVSLPTLLQRDVNELAGGTPRDAMQAALLLQGIKVIWFTFENIEATENAGTRADAKAPKGARPPIPGSGSGEN